jgi:hypothetical protein
MRNYIGAFLLFMVLSFVGTSVALAQSNEELFDLAKPVLDALLAGHYMHAAALGLVLGVALVRRFGSKRWPILASRKAAPFLVLIGSFGAAMATSLAAGAAISLSMVWIALKVAVAAAGGYSLLKPLLSKVPFIGRLFDGESRLASAKAAGDAAVKAEPAEGADVAFRDFP